MFPGNGTDYGDLAFEMVDADNDRADDRLIKITADSLGEIALPDTDLGDISADTSVFRPPFALAGGLCGRRA